MTCKDHSHHDCLVSAGPAKPLIRCTTLLSAAATPWISPCPTAAAAGPAQPASTAVTCSTLRRAAAAAISTVKVRSRAKSSTFQSFTRWIERHSTSLNNLQGCSVTVRGRRLQQGLHSLCRQLRQLHLEGVAVQLGPASGCPGVLQYCSGLTALSLQSVAVGDVAAAAAAIATLPKLQSLRLQSIQGGQRRWLFAELSSAAVLPQLTHLSLDYSLAYWRPPQEAAGDRLRRLHR
jgi:hypothetical protein